MEVRIAFGEQLGDLREDLKKGKLVLDHTLESETTYSRGMFEYFDAQADCITFRHKVCDLYLHSKRLLNYFALVGYYDTFI